MELRTILVNLDVDAYAPNVLACAVELAGRFGARVAGVVAAALPTNLISVEGSAVSVGLYEAERKNLESRLNELESTFIATVPAKLRDGCVAVLDTPNAVVATAARRADLIVAGTRPGGFEARSRNLDLGTLLLTAGRPVLVTAPDCTAVKAQTIIVGWKDGREARRAVADAMPLLKTAGDVLVAAIGEGDRANEKASVDDVVAWLRSHEVKARGDVYPLTGTAGESLGLLARQLDADLIVSGAYGHSRMRELIFGGVTRDLLGAAAVNRFLSN